MVIYIYIHAYFCDYRCMMIEVTQNVGMFCGYNIVFGVKRVTVPSRICC